MRNLILAFGLFLLPAVTMAAPSNPSSCKIISSSSSFVATNCTAAERKLIAAAQAKPTTKQVDKGLDFLAGKQYLVINTVCGLMKGGRRKAARRLVERCYRRAGEGQRLILGNALKNLSDIKACKGIKVLGQQVNCMIDQDNKVLLPLIERTLDAHEAYMEGVKFMINHGCTFKGGKLKCAGFSPIGAILFLVALLTSRRSDRKEWWGFEALGYLQARGMVWAIEDELWRARWVERLIEIAITLTAFSFGGLILGAASTLLAHKRYGWASIFTLLISVLVWGSALEWLLFLVKAGMCFLANTNEGFEFLRWVAHRRWKRQVAKLK